MQPELPPALQLLHGELIMTRNASGEEEEEAAEEAGREEERPRPKPKYSIDEEAEQKPLNEAEKAMLAAKKKHEEEEATKLREYEEQRRKQREREEEELKQLKEKQERRRREREEEERIMAERRREEEERRKQEEEERKRKAEEEKRRKEEEKKKRQQMMAGLNASTGPNFELPKKDKTTDKFDKFGNIVKAKAEMGLTKEQQEEQKRRYLGEIMKPLSTQGMDISGLRAKIKEFHQKICRLEADKYDLEKRGERQDYDLKELNERQRQISRNKALKKGLDPEEAANSRYPPKVPTASKYDRQIDRRSYSDRRHLFENPAKPKQANIFHGSARPPSTWGRKENEELENLRRNLEPPKYIEQVKVENARPPMEPIPSQPVDVYENGGNLNAFDEEEEE
uniref:Troponin T n=1 Tax=Trichuris muris TaxID=70415 RepID=A0A5S6PYH4_TRIMR